MIIITVMRMKRKVTRTTTMTVMLTMVIIIIIMTTFVLPIISVFLSVLLSDCLYVCLVVGPSDSLFKCASLFLCPMIQGSNQSPEEQRLLNDLFSNYTAWSRPVEDKDDVVTVKFSIQLNQIVNLVSSKTPEYIHYTMRMRETWILKHNFIRKARLL